MFFGLWSLDDLDGFPAVLSLSSCLAPAGVRLPGCGHGTCAERGSWRGWRQVAASASPGGDTGVHGCCRAVMCGSQGWDGLLLVFSGSPGGRELGLVAQATKLGLVLRVLGLQQPWLSRLGENTGVFTEGDED